MRLADMFDCAEHPRDIDRQLPVRELAEAPEVAEQHRPRASAAVGRRAGKALRGLCPMLLSNWNNGLRSSGLAPDLDINGCTRVARGRPAVPHCDLLDWREQMLARQDRKAHAQP